MTSDVAELIPGKSIPVERMPGHWVLARLGKRVLRPGGRELTSRMLGALAIGSDDDVVELAPGLGSTTEMVLGAAPRTYVGVDRDPVSAERVAHVVAGPGRSVVQASAADTGLADASADVVFGEAYLTMQPASQKQRVLAELARITRPGGRMALHEVAVIPDSVDEARAAAISAELTDAIKVNVSPLTMAGWRELLDDAGFDIVAEFDAPLRLLEPRRLIADEGPFGAARFASNVIRQPDMRRRVLSMRGAMHRNRHELGACSIVAVRRGSDPAN